MTATPTRAPARSERDPRQRRADGPGLEDHDAAWDIRFADPEGFTTRIAQLPPGPVTTYLKARVAHSHGEYDACLRLCEEAEPGLQEPTIWRARLLETRGNVLADLGIADEARSLLAEAWTIYDGTDDLVGRASIRQNTAAMAMQPAETSMALWADALDLAEQAGRDDLRGVIMLNVAGRGDEVGMSFEERTRLVEEARAILLGCWPGMAVRGLAYQAEWAMDAGRIDEAVRLAAELPVAASIRDTAIRIHVGLAQSTIALADDRPEDAAAVLETILEHHVVPDDEPQILHHLGRAYRRAGRPEDAARTAEKSYLRQREIMLSARQAAGRALDVWHRTSLLRQERAAEQARVEALEGALNDLQRANARIHELSSRDVVTGLHNRQHLMARAPSLLAAAPPRLEDGARGEVALVDLDYFKKINDSYGHSVGDSVLVAFAEQLRRVIVRGDVVARYGGEEFVVVRPRRADGSSGCLAHTLTRLRDAIATGRWADAEGNALPRVTMSVGIARAGTDLDAAIARADALMYEVKGGGRDGIRVEPAAGGCCCVRDGDCGPAATGSRGPRRRRPTSG